MSKNNKFIEDFDYEFDTRAYKNNKKKDKRQLRKAAAEETKFINQFGEIFDDEETITAQRKK